MKRQVLKVLFCFMLLSLVSMLFTAWWHSLIFKLSYSVLILSTTGFVAVNGRIFFSGLRFLNIDALEYIKRYQAKELKRFFAEHLSKEKELLGWRVLRFVSMKPDTDFDPPEEKNQILADFQNLWNDPHSIVQVNTRCKLDVALWPPRLTYFRTVQYITVWKEIDEETEEAVDIRIDASTRTSELARDLLRLQDANELVRSQ